MTHTGTRLGINDFRQKRLGSRIAVKYTVLPTLFIIEYDLQSQAGAFRPAGVRGTGAVSTQISGVFVTH